MSNKTKGAIDNPLTLTEALSGFNAMIQPGHRVWLLDGVKSGIFTNTLVGLPDSEIIVSPHSGQPVIDGHFEVNGSNIIFRDLEFCWSGWAGRESAQSGSNPTDLEMRDIAVHAPRCKFINCIIHDLRSPGFWSPAIDAEFCGCIVYNIGWLGTDRGHGHGLYIQNGSGGIKTIKDCIILNTFGNDIACYSSNGVNLRDIHFIGNTCFNAAVLGILDHPDILIGADSNAATRIVFNDNMTYGGLGLNIYTGGVEFDSLIDNYCPNGKAGIYTAIDESGNYWGPTIGNTYFVRPNQYQTKRANITIYNEAQADSVQVDVSGVLTPGTAYQLRNAQDYFVDIQTGNVAQDGTINVDMQAVNRSVATPVAWTAPATTFPLFGCLVLEAV